MNGNKFKEADESFRRVLHENPGCVDAYLGLGKAYTREDRWKEAHEQFQKANKLDPGQ